MKTQLFQKEDINKIQAELEKGSVIAFPTDTVFGVGCRYDDEQALICLKQAKQRDAHKPIPLMVGNIKQMEEVAYISDRAKLLIERYMPGSITLILPKKDTVPSYVTNHMDTIAVRMPDDAFVLALLRNKPMLVSSANLSGELPGKDEEEVLKQLDGRVHGIVVGKAKENIPSTIVDMTKEEVEIIREGSILKEDILNIVKEKK